MEFVYVVPREKLFPDHYPQGLVPFGGGSGLARRAFEAAIREHGFFVERAYAERTPSLKQVIPYTVVASGEKVLLLRRLKGGGDARLHDKLSIGVGGHINPEDLDPLIPAPSGGAAEGSTEAERIDPVRAGTERELAEELHLGGSYTLQSVGILNDDSNPVGAVHVGLVQVLTTEGPVEIREKDVLEGRLVDGSELRALRDEGANLETWSALLIDQLEQLLPRSLLALS